MTVRELNRDQLTELKRMYSHNLSMNVYLQK